MRRSLASISLMAVALVGVAVGEDVKSGLKVGDKADAFQVRNITGQNAAISYLKDDRGSLCYR